MARLTDEERRWKEMVAADFSVLDPPEGTNEHALLCHLSTALQLLDRLDSEPSPEGDDLAAVRAEGRRLLADFHALGTEDDGFRRDRLIDFFYDHADALLADPPDSLPEGEDPSEVAAVIEIIEDSQATHVEWIEYLAKHGDDLRPHEEIAGDEAHHREAIDNYDRVLAVLRRLVPVTEGGERDG